MPKNSKMTATQREYRKELNRVKRAIKRAESRGFLVPDKLKPIEIKRPNTRSVNKLKRIKPKDIYEKSKYVDKNTGEIIPGKAGRKLEREVSAKKAANTRRLKAQQENLENAYNNMPAAISDYDKFPYEADIIIQNFRSDVIGRFPENAGPIVNTWLNNVLTMYDKEDVAEMLEKSTEAGASIDYSVAYDNELLLGRIAQMMDFLPGASTGMKDRLVEALEYDEDWELPE